MGIERVGREFDYIHHFRLKIPRSFVIRYHSLLMLFRDPSDYL